MWLILTEPYDDTGTWLAERLRAYVTGLVVHLTTRDFGRRAHTTRLIVDSDDWFKVTIENGTIIDSRALRGVINRICALPPSLASRLSDPQRSDAQKNFSLPLLRLLHGFGGIVLNRPTAQGVSGDFRLDFEWAGLAAQAGIPRAPGLRLNGNGNARPGAAMGDVVPVAVIGDQVLALDEAATRLPSPVISSCRRLAALGRSSLLGLDLLRTPADEWHFIRAHMRVNLIPGGDDVLAAVARALTGPVARLSAGKATQPPATVTEASGTRV